MMKTKTKLKLKNISKTATKFKTKKISQNENHTAPENYQNQVTVSTLALYHFCFGTPCGFPSGGRST